MLEGEKAASLQWVDIGRPSVGRESGLSEGGHPQSVDAGFARTRADFQCAEVGFSMPSIF